MREWNFIFGLVAMMAVLALAPAARAVQIQDLVRIKGHESSKLTGMGLVVGLSGTGDGGKSRAAVESLAAVTQRLMNSNVTAADFKDSRNVAVVMLSAELPSAGVREGDKIDVRVSATNAKSLAGGRLFLIPMQGPLPDSPIFAFAEGPITVENPATPNVGVIKNGAQLTRDVFAQFMDPQGYMTLVLDQSIATWPMASNLASLVNGVVRPDGPPVARAADPRNVVVEIPIEERSDPAAFISQILYTDLDPSLIPTGARVVINEQSGTIVISGNVQISPVIIRYQGLTLTTITPELPPSPINPRLETHSFVGLDPEGRGGARLADLMTALNQLKVEAADCIAIIREIHKSGKLHAQLIVE